MLTKHEALAAAERAEIYPPGADQEYWYAFVKGEVLW